MFTKNSRINSSLYERQKLFVHHLNLVKRQSQTVSGLVNEGKVISIVTGPVSTELTLEVAPGVRVTSSITSTSAQSLGLKEGDNAYAVIKASSVMVAVD
ncbi:TOBE domain-containing protein [Comamonas thiooxydans]|uniref:TOBE domain-containing protein n=1 Tax=Comamonas thiooxydans TaxID=363952 RepID=UPI00227737CA|nr:TOBE domain-containing protein [Comamonas thiooxydans]